MISEMCGNKPAKFAGLGEGPKGIMTDIEVPIPHQGEANYGKHNSLIIQKISIETDPEELMAKNELPAP